MKGKKFYIEFQNPIPHFRSSSQPPVLPMVNDIVSKRAAPPQVTGQGTSDTKVKNTSETHDPKTRFGMLYKKNYAFCGCMHVMHLRSFHENGNEMSLERWEMYGAAIC